MASINVQPGVYRHFKGKLYEVIGVAQKVDSDESFVIYRPLYGDMLLVARPLEEFSGTVKGEFGDELRFQLVELSAVTCECHPDSQN
ncbi:DUF1653 domain-containing protein [Tundrisphaera sp. TA3]|uniref:DUF1653 domain-containing protein n=1 Tax=Tundrisphaera sp. TA3 TaxID=3435775 RepID=UPI003EB97A7D